MALQTIGRCQVPEGNSMPINYANANTDLVSLIEQKAGISLAPKANNFQFGKEYWGTCPFCKAGGDRFHVWPEGSRPHYWCRICGMQGSPAQFLVDYLGLNYYEANNELGFEYLEGQQQDRPEPSLRLEKEQPPSKQWQEAAMLILERAEHYLWHPKSVEGQQALAYLHWRGFQDETIKQARLGYVPLGKDGRWYKGTFEQWGIDPEKLRDELRAKGGVSVPNGILIPWLEGSRVWKLATKRPGEQMSYGQVMGSGEGLYNVDALEPGQPAQIVEGEFDSLSVQQEAGDLIACVATGSLTRGRTLRWLAHLRTCSAGLQSFDADPPDERDICSGDEGAHYWLEKLPDFIRWRPWVDDVPGAWRFKDPNEMLQYKEEFRLFTGHTLRDWIQTGINALSPTSAWVSSSAEEPVVLHDFQQQISVQQEYERLSSSERVETPAGPGTIWDMKQLRHQIERDAIRVVLDSLRGSPQGTTQLFPARDVQAVQQKTLAW
jgi:hypothetical protein